MSTDPPDANEPTYEFGSVRPTSEVRAEITEFIRQDQTRLGEVFSGRERGLTAEQIAAELGVSTSNFVSNYSRTLRSLTNGDLPTAPTLAIGSARTYRRFLRQNEWSPAAQRYLERNLAEHTVPEPGMMRADVPKDHEGPDDGSRELRVG